MKKRSEREKELRELAKTDAGKWQLTDMAKVYLGVPEGEAISQTTLLIYVILSQEYGHSSIAGG